MSFHSFLFTVIVKKSSNYINREPFPIFFLSQVELFIDEGILIRFQGTNSLVGADLVPCIAFSPSPEFASAKKPALRAKAEKEPKRASQRKPSTRSQAPPMRTREHLVLVIDNYAVRHGKAFVPLSVIKKRLASYGEAVLTETIRESQQQGDFQIRGSGLLLELEPFRTGGCLL